MLTMGTDFTYTYSETWFRQMDRLIHHVNKVAVVTLIYFQLLHTSIMYLKHLKDILGARFCRMVMVSNFEA